MLSADQVPVTNPHSRMQWPKWVVLIAGSTGSALRAVRPPNLHITPWYSARSRQTLSESWIIISLAPSHHCPGHSGELVGKRDGGDFGRPSCQQRCDPGPILGAVDLGIANDGECAGHEQAAQIAIPLFADTAEPIPTPARVLFGNQPDPGREVATRSEGFRIGDARDKGSDSGPTPGMQLRRLLV